MIEWYSPREILPMSATVHFENTLRIWVSSELLIWLIDGDEKIKTGWFQREIDGSNPFQIDMWFYTDDGNSYTVDQVFFFALKTREINVLDQSNT